MQASLVPKRKEKGTKSSLGTRADPVSSADAPSISSSDEQDDWTDVTAEAMIDTLQAQQEDLASASLSAALAAPIDRLEIQEACRELATHPPMQVTHQVMEEWFSVVEDLSSDPILLARLQQHPSVQRLLGAVRTVPALPSPPMNEPPTASPSLPPPPPTAPPAAAAAAPLPSVAELRNRHHPSSSKGPPSPLNFVASIVGTVGRVASGALDATADKIAQGIMHVLQEVDGFFSDKRSEVEEEDRREGEEETEEEGEAGVRERVTRPSTPTTGRRDEGETIFVKTMRDHRVKSILAAGIAVVVLVLFRRIRFFRPL